MPLKLLSAVVVTLAFATTVSAQTAPPLWMNKSGAKPTLETVEIHKGPIKVGDVAVSLEATHLRTARLASAYTLEAVNITFPKGTPFFASRRPLYVPVIPMPGSPPTAPLPKTIGDLQWCSMKPESKMICFTYRDDGAVLNSLFPTQPIPSRFSPLPGSPGPIPDLVEEPISFPPLKSTIYVESLKAEGVGLRVQHEEGSARQDYSFGWAMRWGEKSLITEAHRFLRFDPVRDATGAIVGTTVSEAP